MRGRGLGGELLGGADGLDDTCTLASTRNKRTDNAGFGAPIFRVVLEVWEAINLCFECFILS